MELVTPEALGLDSGQLARVGEHLRRNYIDADKIPGSVTLVARHGQACWLDVAGQRDLERGTAMAADTIFRIYSMSKPVTSVALMTLYERGLFSLEDPVHRFIPSWRNLGVRKAGAFPLFETVPCARPMTIRDLLRHTSGLTYDFLRETNIDYAYRKLQVANPQPGYTLRHMIDQLAELPLEFSPGECWNYSVATDVLGYLIEVISGQSLPDYLRETIFEPLGMVDTAFNIVPDKVDRLASCYERNAAKQLICNDDGQSSMFRDREFYSGGGGLLSTVGDYYRFCQMLLQGGTLDGQRVIGSRTLEYMTQNHLPGNVDLAAIAMGSFSETDYEGVGFGLGFANKVDPVANGNMASHGTFFWGGLASTLFWVDPAEELVVIFMTQLMPSSTFNFRGQLESMIYAALD
ncbi:serine hydrolase [Kineobactrum sediminis]|uniref:Serine hydrolase n=1 Tax=Kineobactrum sediminis TaxID=1905677 RepID=A0A2N5XYU5_9GAMM|nr:serine hydrolase domain-containing protein [Kineobactrum sediminis]PLW81318.1 serine hydrolase [Kineobactrum sediminis]